MACPGGCIGGGGQPKTHDPTAVLKRMQAIYDVDAHEQGGYPLHTACSPVLPSANNGTCCMLTDTMCGYHPHGPPALASWSYPDEHVDKNMPHKHVLTLVLSSFLTFPSCSAQVA